MLRLLIQSRFVGFLESAFVFQGGLLEVAAEEVLPVLQVLDNGQQAGTWDKSLATSPSIVSNTAVSKINFSTLLFHAER